MEEQQGQDEVREIGPDAVVVTNWPSLNFLEKTHFLQLIVLVIVLVMLLVFGVYQFSVHPAAPPVSDAYQAAQKAQAELQTKDVELKIEVEKDGRELRFKVAQLCVERGMVPQVLNGNVTCDVPRRTK